MNRIRHKLNPRQIVRRFRLYGRFPLVAGLIAFGVQACGCLPGAGLSGPSGASGESGAGGLFGLGVAVSGDGAYELSSPDRIELFVVTGETAGVRLDISGRGRIDVQTSDFVSAAGDRLSNNVSRFRVHSVHVTDWPSWHIKRTAPKDRIPTVVDVLVPADAPRGGLPASGGSSPTVVWLDFAIPADTSAGRYNGQVVVLRGGGAAHRVDIELNVLPLTMPDARPLVSADIDHRLLFWHHVRFEGRRFDADRILTTHPASGRLSQVLDQTMQMLRSYGVTGQLPWLYPVTKIDASQSVVTDWSDYDAAVGGYISGDAYGDNRLSPLWKLPLNADFPRPPGYGSLSSPLYARHVADYVEQMGDHLNRRGWVDRACVVLPHGRLDDPLAWEAAEHFGYLIRRVDPDITLMSTLIPQDLSGAGWFGFERRELASFVDVWNCPGQFYDRLAIARDFASNAWLLADRPPYSGTTEISASPADTWALAWQGRSGQADTVDLGLINPWPQVGKASPQQCVDHDARALLYPGEAFGLDHPVASMRLARIRRARFDQGYLSLLSAAGRDDLASTVVQSLVRRVGAQVYGVHFADGRQGSWQPDARIWSAARWVMADALTIGDGDAGGESPTGNSLIRRRRFIQSAGSIAVEAAGCRVRLRPDNGAAPFEVACTVRIDNFTDSSVSPVVRFSQLPEGWAADAIQRDAGAIAPGASRIVEMTARTHLPPGGASGMTELPMTLATEGGVKIPFRARVCHLVPTRATTKPRIDGDLADWPIGVGNHASDFILISGADAGSDDPICRPPRDTTVLVMFDDDNLYFAARCPYQAADDRSVAPHIEDLIPRGAEMLEILIDPSNTGAYLAGDLYRIAVRLRGAQLSRGVDVFPPIGGYRMWTVDARYDVKVKRDQWTMEMAVPREAFNDSDYANAVWAINFARFDLAAEAYSTWSQATGFAYNPHWAGNMTMPLARTN